MCDRAVYRTPPKLNERTPRARDQDDRRLGVVLLAVRAAVTSSRSQPVRPSLAMAAQVCRKSEKSTKLIPRRHYHISCQPMRRKRIVELEMYGVKLLLTDKRISRLFDEVFDYDYDRGLVGHCRF